MDDSKFPNQEELLNEIRKLLPGCKESKAGKSTKFISGDPGEVILSVKGSTLTISLFSIVWEGPGTPVVHPIQLATLAWDRIPTVHLLPELKSLVDTTRQIRRAKFGKCDRCGESQSPEWMHDEKICQSCAVRFLGVVY